MGGKMGKIFIIKFYGKQKFEYFMDGWQFFMMKKRFILGNGELRKKNESIDHWK